MDYEETKSLKDKLLHKRTAADFGITILFFLLNLYWPAFTYSEDVFDQYPAFNSEMGIGKLTPEERSRLEEFIKAYSNVASRRSPRAVCSEIDDACKQGYRKCMNECTSTVFDYQRGEYLSTTDAGSHCNDACLAGRRSCER